MKTEIDRLSREKKELTEQIQDAESQLEWVRSERDDEVAKLISDKKVLHDRLHDAETQLQQLKSRKREELKVNHVSFYFLLDFLYDFKLEGIQLIASEICLFSEYELQKNLS